LDVEKEPMAARELTPESPEQTEAMFPKLDDGQIARLAFSRLTSLTMNSEMLLSL
jgi:hypothetical protein